ncbi:hypothetical protein C4580_03910 [Candidatus Woesearchaeota archaeon]|nr:MAG: hypothetical protein C4580_03910 [Candidatus Woesearchaeota archaeon]
MIKEKLYTNFLGGKSDVEFGYFVHRLAALNKSLLALLLVEVFFRTTCCSYWRNHNTLLEKERNLEVFNFFEVL